MNKRQLMFEKNELTKKLEEIDKQLEIIEKGLCLTDNDKPFSNYNTVEMQDLYNISKNAYNYLTKNPNENIKDFNLLQAQENKVVLAN